MQYKTLSDFDLLKLVVGERAHYVKAKRLSELLGLVVPHQGLLCDSAVEHAIPLALGAIKELFVRASAEAARDDGMFLADPAILSSFLSSRYAALEHEVFVCVWLDTRHQLIECDEMFHGTLTQTHVYPREVVKRALQRNARSVVFAHNHPSGDPKPSTADITLTKVLRSALALIDVAVLDHVVVAGSKSTSMATLGWL